MKQGIIRNAGFRPDLEIITEGNNVYLKFSIDDKGTAVKTDLVTTALLGKAKMPREAFENPDGTPITMDTDYLGTNALNRIPLPDLLRIRERDY